MGTGPHAETGAQRRGGIRGRPARRARRLIVGIGAGVLAAALALVPATANRPLASGDISITVAADRAEAQPGDVVLLTATVRNQGPSGTFSVQLSATPDGLELVAGGPAPTGPIGAGGEIVLELPARLAGGGELVCLELTAESGEADWEEIGPENNTAEACVAVFAPPRLAVTLDDRNATPAFGDRFDYEVTVLNHGGAGSVAGVEVRLPAGLRVVGAGACGQQGTTLVCPGGTVPARGRMTTTIGVELATLAPTTLIAHGSVPGTGLADDEATPVNGGPLATPDG